MKNTLILLLNICLVALQAYSNPSSLEIDDSIWNGLLNSYVSEDGQVEYKGFEKDKIQLDEYLRQLGENVPDDSWRVDEKLAYWINVYNAFTVSLIVKHYPVKSIMDIKNAWDIKFIQLGEQTYTLNDIEHQIIRKEFDEPRIHFVLVCAAISCPILLNEAYTADNLEQQLQQQGEKFINDPSKNLIKNNKANISQIFNWFGEDFTKHGSLIEFMNLFSSTKLDADVNIKFMEYNWGLNE